MITKSNNTMQIGWDWLVRLTHWLVAALFLSNYYFTEKGSENHENVGWTVLVLIVLRFVWGSTLANGPNRLSAFVPTKAAVKKHIIELKTRKSNKVTGHNPFGAVAIYLLWLGLTASVLTGWGMDTDWGFENDVDQWHEFAVDFTFFMVCLHIVAVILVSIWLNKNLIRAMVFR